MKYTNLAYILFAAILTSVPAVAESPFERDLVQLKSAHDKSLAAAVAAASDPINRRYQQSLDQLLRRATQAADLDAAIKIRETIDGLLTQNIGKQLAGTWGLKISNVGGPFMITLKEDGTVIDSGGGKSRWRVEGAKLYVGNIDEYELPIQGGKLTGVNKAQEFFLTLTKQK